MRPGRKHPSKANKEINQLIDERKSKVEVSKVVKINYEPRPWQLEAHLGMRRFNVLVIHRRAGKSVLAVMELIDKALKCAYQNGRYAYIAPLKTQAKDVAWGYLKMYGLQVPGAVVNESESYVEFTRNVNGIEMKSRVKIYGADDPDSLRGSYLDGVVLDEVAQMKAAVWGEIVRPMLMDRKGWVLFLGTPKGINLLSELFFRELDAVDKEQWYRKSYTCYETNAISKEEIENSKREMSEQQFKQEMLCDFGAGSEDNLLTIDIVREAMSKKMDAREVEWEPLVMGVDVARQGNDSSAIACRQGKLVFPIVSFRTPDLMCVVEKIIEQANKMGPDAIYIDGTGGYGGGVIDRLRQMGYKVVDVQFGSRKQLIDEKFLNKRAEIWFRMAEWVKAGGCLPDDKILSMNLCAPKYWHNGSGYLQLEGKEAMKERGLPSPDRGDAVALTFAFNPGSSISNRSMWSQTLGYEKEPEEKWKLFSSR